MGWFFFLMYGVYVLFWYTDTDTLLIVLHLNIPLEEWES